jgi:hypothetical protein
MNQTNLYVEENAVRLIAAQTVLLTSIALYTQWELIMILLIVDFALRAFTTFISPMAFVAKKVVAILKLKPKPIFAPPKKFAALLGFIFSLTIATLFFFNAEIYAYFIGAILIVCAILESAFEVCVGCYVYDILVAPIVNK